jgi:hypothetical protein
MEWIVGMYSFIAFCMFLSNYLIDMNNPIYKKSTLTIASLILGLVWPVFLVTKFFVKLLQERR